MSVELHNLKWRVAESSLDFIYSSTIYAIITRFISPLDLFLLYLGSLFPAKVGLRIGTLTGYVLSPLIVREVISKMRHHNILSDFIVDNHKFVFSAAGAIIGGLYFEGFLWKKGYSRFASNILAAGATGGNLGILFNMYIFAFTLPNWSPVALFQSIIIYGLVGTVAGLIFGTPIAIVNHYVERKYY